MYHIIGLDCINDPFIVTIMSNILSAFKPKIPPFFFSWDLKCYLEVLLDPTAPFAALSHGWIFPKIFFF